MASTLFLLLLLQMATMLLVLPVAVCVPIAAAASLPAFDGGLPQEDSSQDGGHG